MAEPRAKNLNQVPAKVWGKWSESERTHFNKVFGFAIIHREHFLDQDLTPDEWHRVCYNFAVLSTDILKRSKNVRYWRPNRYG